MFLLHWSEPSSRYNQRKIKKHWFPRIRLTYLIFWKCVALNRMSHLHDHSFACDWNSKGISLTVIRHLRCEFESLCDSECLSKNEQHVVMTRSWKREFFFFPFHFNDWNLFEGFWLKPLNMEAKLQPFAFYSGFSHNQSSFEFNL